MGFFLFHVKRESFSFVNKDLGQAEIFFFIKTYFFWILPKENLYLKFFFDAAKILQCATSCAPVSKTETPKTFIYITLYASQFDVFEPEQRLAPGFREFALTGQSKIVIFSWKCTGARSGPARKPFGGIF